MAASDIGDDIMVYFKPGVGAMPAVRLPASWRQTRTGTTKSLIDPSEKPKAPLAFPRYAIFEGPRKTRETAKKMIRAAFAELERAGFVARLVIGIPEFQPTDLDSEWSDGAQASSESDGDDDGAPVRPSPKEHAGDFQGRRKKGGDGKMWESRVDRRGVFAWRRVSSGR